MVILHIAVGQTMMATLLVGPGPYFNIKRYEYSHYKDNKESRETVLTL